MDEPNADSSLIVRGHFDALCQQIRHAMEPIHVHAVSLYDEGGGLLWMTSSVLNDDLAAGAAFKRFAAHESVFVAQLPSERGRPQGEAQSAVVFRISADQGQQMGAAMVILSSTDVPSAGAAGLLSSLLRETFRSFIALRPPPKPRAAPRPAPPPAKVAAVKNSIPTLGTAEIVARTPPVRKKAAAPLTVPAAPPKAAPLKAVPPKAAVNPMLEALRQSSLALYVQRLVPLEQNVRILRYEVLWDLQSLAKGSVAQLAHNKLLAEKPSSLIDRRVFTELVEWLKKHPLVWKDNGARFSIKLSKSALNDREFVPFVRRVLEVSKLPKGLFGFEIPAATPRKYQQTVTQVAAALHDSGCFLALDNFSLRAEAFAALHCPGVQFIKLTHDLTVKMQTDHITRAAISAIGQMARVLGIQTVAKRTKLETDLVRLASYGVDFVQSESISPAVLLASLVTQGHAA